MNQKVIQTTIPLSPTLINEYCIANANGDNNILFEFDVSKSPLSAEHILGYLSNLKIDFKLVGFDDEFLIQYTRTKFLVGSSNLVKHHANLLAVYKTGVKLFGEVAHDYETLCQQYPEEIQKQLDVINGLSLFLVQSSSVSEEVKQHKCGDNVTVVMDNLDEVGVNFARLIELPTALLWLVGDGMSNIHDQTYYTHYYDNYIYGGDKLISFFINNPTCLLRVAVEASL